MGSFVNFHYAMTVVLYPLVNLITLGALLFGAVRTPLRRPFVILSAAGILFLASQLLHLVYFLKTALDLTVPGPSVVRVLFPLQAFGEYVGFVLNVWGIVVLVHTATRLKTE